MHQTFKYYKPHIARVVATPLWVPALTLENNRGMENGSVGTDSFNDCYESNNLLISVNHSSNLCTDAEMNALFIHIVQILRQNIVLLDHIYNHIKEFLDSCLVQCLSMSLLQTLVFFTFKPDDVCGTILAMLHQFVYQRLLQCT
jgi:hypothetical protein